MPGRTGPAAAGAEPRDCRTSTRVKMPRSSHSSSTSRAHPLASSASEAKREFIHLYDTGHGNPARHPCAPRHHARRALRRDRGGRAAREGWRHRVGRADGGPAARRARGLDGDRCEGRADDAGPGRLPHAPRLWRQSRARAGDAPGGKELRRDRKSGRRHRLDGGGHSRREQRAASRRQRAPAAGADGRGRDHGRDQVGLRPGHRERAAMPADRAQPRGGPPHFDLHHAAGRAHVADGIRGTRGRIRGPGVHAR